MTSDTIDRPIVTIANRLTLAQAGKLLGKSPSCLYRWIRDGNAGVHLEHARYGGAIFTSEDALDRFAQRVAEAKSAKHRPAAVAQAGADADLAAAGL